ncbi:ABC transporter ATP-binding protein [Candidatus Wolfebacteria bacterium]|nr:ABC transporter ATP-binding protein [Candidatus Wolfebacteria bacterium]
MTIPKELAFLLDKIKNKKGLYVGMTAVIVASFITAFIPYIYGRLVDVAIKHNSQMKMILEFILLWLILSLLSDFLTRYGSRQAYKITNDVTNNLTIDLNSHIINLPMKFHKEMKMGKVFRQVDTGIGNLDQFIENTVFHFIPSVISFFVALIIILFVEWRLSLILIAASLCFIAVTLIYIKKIVKKQKEMHAGWDKAYGELRDSMINAHAVKATTNEGFEKGKNIKNFNAASKKYLNWRDLWQNMNIFQGLIFSLSFVASFGTGIIMLKQGLLSPGKLVMFVGYISMMTGPLYQLSNQYRMTKSALLSFKRAIKYYNILPENDSPATKEMKIQGDVSFENVFFYYKKGSPILRNISFKVFPGQTIAIVGESGVGKTTLVDLIGRYYLPAKGKIFIDGADVKKIKLKSLRKQMALVPQEILLFNDTIKQNIGYGRIGATDEEIIKAAKAANAHEFIEKFPKKYEQLVGERGIKLSTGQKQRVAIARAILRNPKILILDEATSALDSVSEKLVQEALNNLVKNRTTFIIAHRLSTIQHADKIIVLENGKIAEMGKHNELMKNPDGIYRNFWELQTAIQKVK